MKAWLRFSKSSKTTRPLHPTDATALSLFYCVGLDSAPSRFAASRCRRSAGSRRSRVVRRRRAAWNVCRAGIRTRLRRRTILRLHRRSILRLRRRSILLIGLSVESRAGTTYLASRSAAITEGLSGVPQCSTHARRCAPSAQACLRTKGGPSNGRNHSAANIQRRRMIDEREWMPRAPRSSCCRPTIYRDKPESESNASYRPWRKEITAIAADADHWEPGSPATAGSPAPSE